MDTIMREAPMGQLARLALGGRVFQYPDEQPGFDRSHFTNASAESEVKDSNTDVEKAGDAGTNVDKDTENTPEHQDASHNTSSSNSIDLEKTKTKDPTLIEWYSENDLDNPKNWSTGKKVFTMFQLCLLTFSIYSGSSIISPAEGTFIEIYGVSAQKSALVLSMYVLGYGFGPLVFSPLSEVPRLGRNIPYMVSFTLYVIITIPLAFVDNFAGIVVLRFLQGFLGGPVLATGGASAGDIFDFNKLPYGIAFWAFAAFGGPGLGPLLSAFAVQNSTWRWSIYEMLILGVFTLILLFTCLPETNAETILLRRAERLRKATGDKALHSESEIKQAEVSILKLSATYLTTPWRVTVQDPSVAFINLYTALIYGTYYSFFESFPLVYSDLYHFNLGISGVIFLSLIVSGILALIIYAVIVHVMLEPYTLKNGLGRLEYRLIPALPSAAVLPVGLFLFAWTSRSDIHWVVPTIGVVLFGISAYILTQSIFLYLPTSYPKYAASLFAANAFLRSALAVAAIHFSQPMFAALGVGRGVSILGGLTVGCFFLTVLLYIYGARLRARSSFAESY